MNIKLLFTLRITVHRTATSMEHSLHNLKTEQPEITTAYFRQDNGGCYKSATVTMLAACRLMRKTTGINVRRVDFSDPQGGKGPCDCKAATIKAPVRRFVCEGHDVLTADAFKDAILSNNGVRGVRVAVVKCEILPPTQPVKWEGVSNVNNLLYEDTSLTVWRAYDIGKGKTYLLSQLQVSKILNCLTVKWISIFGLQCLGLKTMEPLAKLIANKLKQNSKSIDNAQKISGLTDGKFSNVR